MRKLMSHLWAKILGVILLCIAATIILLGASALNFTFGNSSYFETWIAQDNARDEAWEVMNRVIYNGADGIETLKDRYSAENSNSRFTVERKSNYDNGYIPVTRNTSENEVYIATYAYDFTVAVDEYNNYEIYFYYNVPQAVSVQGTKAGNYRVTIYVDQNMRVKNDVYYNEYQLFNTIQSKETPILIGVGSSFLIGLIVLFMEFVGAGRRTYDREIHGNLLTKIPFDVFTIADYMLVMICAKMFFDYLNNATGMYRGISFEKFILDRVLAIISLLIGALFFYAWLMTLAIHIKKKQLPTIVGKVWIFCFAWIRYIPLIWKVFLVSALWLLFTLFAVSSTANEFVLFYLVVTCVLIILILYQAYYAIQIHEASQELAKGNLSYKIDTRRMRYLLPSLKEHAENLNSIGDGMQKAVQEQMRSERLKAELITNVSHDIKTPLTSIISYVDLLQKEHTEEEQKQYLEVLARQSQRLKKLTEDVVEASKASTGNIEVRCAETSIPEIIEQALGEYEDKLKDRNLIIMKNIPDALSIQTDGRLLWRILRNLLSNISKYALPGTRVYIDVQNQIGQIKLIFKNTSKEPLNISTTELLERFTRGDSSRHTEGSGLGLNIAQSLTELLGGQFDLTIDGDLFKATITLPKNQ